MFEKLPSEILLIILSNLSTKDLFKIAQVNKRLSILARNHTLWKQKCDALKLNTTTASNYRDCYRKQVHSTDDRVYFIVGDKLRPYSKNEKIKRDEIWESFPNASEQMIFLNKKDANTFVEGCTKKVFEKPYQTAAIFKVNLIPEKDFILKQGGVSITKNINETVLEVVLFITVSSADIQKILSVNYEGEELVHKENIAENVYNKCSIM